MDFRGSGVDGFLRRSISVREDDNVVSLNHPCWELNLPREWVIAAPGVSEFLKRKASVDALDGSHDGIKGFAELLQAQGCLTFKRDVDHYSLKEVKQLFTAIRNEWYGQYYRHGLWAVLREGTLTKNGFVTWLVY